MLKGKRCFFPQNLGYPWVWCFFPSIWGIFFLSWDIESSPHSHSAALRTESSLRAWESLGCSGLGIEGHPDPSEFCSFHSWSFSNGGKQTVASSASWVSYSSRFHFLRNFRQDTMRRSSWRSPWFLQGYANITQFGEFSILAMWSVTAEVPTYISQLHPITQSRY